MQPLLAGQSVQVVCNGIPGGPGTPQISFTYIPPYGSFDKVEGQELHVSTADYAVALYIQVFGGWWTKPTFAQPITPLQPDGSYSSPYATGGSDQLAAAIAAFLIPQSYKPPQLSGSPLPARTLSELRSKRPGFSISKFDQWKNY
jgi:hypothetical protein